MFLSGMGRAIADDKLVFLSCCYPPLAGAGLADVFALVHIQGFRGTEDRCRVGIGFGVAVRKYCSGSVELMGELDLADDVGVEVVEILGGDPEFEDGAAAGLLDGVAAYEVGVELEAGDVVGAVVFNVPVSGDSEGVVLVQERVEDGLFGQAGLARRARASWWRSTAWSSWDSQRQVSDAYLWVLRIGGRGMR